MATAENLLLNGSMEAGTENSASYWRLQSYHNDDVTVTRHQENPYQGFWCITLSCAADNDIRLIQQVNVSPSTHYKISGWIKAEKIAPGGIGANISLVEHFHTSKDLKDTGGQWEYVELYLKTAADTEKITISFGIGGFGSINKGKAVFDEIVMEEISSAPASAHIFLIPGTATAQLQSETGQPQSLPSKLLTPPTPLNLVLVTLPLIIIPSLLIILLRKKSSRPLILRENLTDLLPPLKHAKPGLKALLFSPYVKVAFFCILAILFIRTAAMALKNDPVKGLESHYLYQADAFLHGKLDVETRQTGMAVYNDKNYVVAPPLPAVILLPFVAIFGFRTEITTIAMLMTIGCILLFYSLLQKLGIARNQRSWLTAAFFTGTGFWFCFTYAHTGTVFSHLCAILMLLCCLNEAFGKGRGLLVGLFLGLAFLARPAVVVYLVLLSIIMLDKKPDRTAIAKPVNLGLFGISLGCCILVYAGYNMLRFTSPWETGLSWLSLEPALAERVLEFGYFHPVYLPFNFTYLFLQGPHFNFTGLKIASLDRFGTSLFLASPFIVFAGLARWRKKLLWGAWLGIAAIILCQLLYFTNGADQYHTQRCTMDFMVLLIILVALGMRRVPEKIWKTAITFAIALNAFSLWIIL